MEGCIMHYMDVDEQVMAHPLDETRECKWQPCGRRFVTRDRRRRYCSPECRKLGVDTNRILKARRAYARRIAGEGK